MRLYGDHVRIYYANAVGRKCLFRKWHAAIYDVMIIRQAERHDDIAGSTCHVRHENEFQN